MIEQFKNKTPYTQILILLLIGIVSIVILSIISSVLMTLLYPEMSKLSAQIQMKQFPVQYMIGTYLPFQIGLFLVPGMLYFVYKKSLNTQEKPTHKPLDYLWSLGLFGLLFCMLPFLTTINSAILESIDMLATVEHESAAYVKSLNHLIGPLASTESYLTALIIIGLLVPICEELFFRGFILNHIAHTRNNNWIGVLLSAFVFTLLHLNWQQFLPILCFGIALGVIYVITKSIFPGIILHALNNSINVIWMRQENTPSFLENYNPYLSAALVLMLLLLLALYHKRLQLK